MRAFRSGSKTYRGSLGHAVHASFRGTARSTDLSALHMAGLQGVSGPGLRAVEKQTQTSTFDDIMAVLGLAAEAAPGIITAARGSSTSSVAPSTSTDPTRDAELARLYAAQAEQQRLLVEAMQPKPWIPGVSNAVVVIGLVVLTGGGLLAYSMQKKG